MFNDKDFFIVNREERNFGFLLFSSLLYDKKFQNTFISILNNYFNQEVFSIDENFDIYSEVALFRDYWFDLGDHNKYTPELHNRRKEIIEVTLDIFNIKNRIISEYNLFWTGKKRESKLWYPGKWDINKIKHLQNEENIEDNKLLRIRWAFNAKPDFLIVSNSNAIFIELKVESGIGDNQEGYNQEQTQYDIILLSKSLIPYLAKKEVKRVMVTQNKESSIKWAEFEDAFSNLLVKKYMASMPKPR